MSEEFTGERWIPGVEGDIQLEHLHRYRFAMQLVVGRRVLDIACGEGYGSDLLAVTASQVTGVDIDGGVVARAQRRYGRSNLSYVQGSCSAIPLPDDSVDVVVSFETIEHHDQHEEMMAEIRRVLVGDGLLIISSPDKHEYSDVPGTTNEFHVKELYRDEFVDLIGRYFANHVVVGQRLIYGSAILGEDPQLVETMDADDGERRFRGVARPIYLIALASDAEIPPYRTGIMETPLYRSGGYQDLDRRLFEANQSNSRLRDESVELHQRIEQAHEQLDERRRELQGARDELAALTESGRQLQVSLEHSRAEVLQLGAEMNRLREQRAEDLQILVSRLDRAGIQDGTDRRDVEQVEVVDPQAHAERLRLMAISRIDQLGAKAHWFKEAYDAVLQSWSWRLTSPVRAASNLGRALVRTPAKLPAMALGSARLAWQRLPMGAQARSRIHFQLRRRFPRFYYRLLGAPGTNTPMLASALRNASAPVSIAPAPDGSAERRFRPHDADAVLLDVSEDWDAYERILAFERALRDRRLDEVDVKPVPILDLRKRDLRDAAREIRLVRSERPKVSIIIPVFNQLRLTVECLTSVSQTLPEGLEYEVIIADDASADEDMTCLASIDGVRYECRDRNLGFLLNAASAAETAKGELLLFLNNDVQVRPGWLLPLLNAFDAADDVAAAGPKFVYPDGRLQEAGVAVRPDASSVMVGLFDDPDRPEYNRQRQVDYCSGACLLVRRDRFFEVGGFDVELAPAYCEDLALGLKLKNAGYRTVYCPDSVVVHHLSATTGAAGQDAKLRLIARNRQLVIDRWSGLLDRLNDVKVVAFYLPQFHPIPENDAWWGAGFTEWRNVTRARPNFEGHYQPRVPADLGYYDLRAVEVMEAQAELAKRFGVHGFCFYYYWFGGKRLLDMPLERMLATGRPDMPFCLCWANENWTRRWDGRERDLLIGQTYSAEDDNRVIEDLARYLDHPRYIRVDGKPFLLVYRVDQFPNFARTSERWRRRCRELGIGEIYIAAVESFTQAGAAVPPSEYGCDGVVEFPPHNFGVPTEPPGPVRPDFKGITYDYQAMIDLYLQRPGVPYPRFRGVMPGWDNTARRQTSSHIFVNNSPEAFQAWLEVVMRQAREQSHADERIVFVNAWNEWAEGTYLEPDTVYGYRWLESVWNAKQSDLLGRHEC